MPEISDAEKALQRKYELLRRKKLQVEQKQASQKEPTRIASVSKPPEGTKIDPVRQAAIEALRKRKSEAASGGKLASSQPVVTTQSESKPSTNIKLGFVIPKRKSEEPSTESKESVPAKKMQSRHPQDITIGGTAHEKLSKIQVESHAAQAIRSLKRPAPRRPVPGSARPQRGVSVEEDPAEHLQASQEQFAEQQFVMPATPQLFVGDLPGHFTSDMLWEFFSQFHDVVDARVVEERCYGYVTFGSFEDAQAVLEFQAQQPVLLEDRQLRITWVHEGDAVGGVDQSRGGESADDEYAAPPRFASAKEVAAQVAEQIDSHHMVALGVPQTAREMVTYDDL